MASSAALLLACEGADAAMTDPQSEKLPRDVVDVPLEHGSYRYVGEVISYEIMAPNSDDASRAHLRMLRGIQPEMRICIDDKFEQEAEAIGNPYQKLESKMGIKRTIVSVSEDGRDFVEVSRPPISDAPDGTLASHRREVVQRTRYWEAKHIHETPAFGDVPATRSITKQSLTYMGPCTGREINLSAEWDLILADAKKPKL